MDAFLRIVDRQSRLHHPRLPQTKFMVIADGPVRWPDMDVSLALCQSSGAQSYQLTSLLNQTIHPLNPIIRWAVEVHPHDEGVG